MSAPTTRTALLALIAVLAALMVPAASFAAPTWKNEPYPAACLNSAGNKFGGEFDQLKNTYLVCGRSVGIILPNDTLRVIPITNEVGTAVQVDDIAPSPDGEFLYSTQRGNGDVQSVFRYRRVGGTTAATATSYKRDTWVPARHPYSTGPKHPAGAYMTTDWYGNIYIANGMWNNPNRNMVHKYASDGRHLVGFGEYTIGWELGLFHTLGGVAVSRDGSKIFTAEVHNGRIVRWDAQANGQYKPAKEFGNHYGRSGNPPELAYWMNTIDPAAPLTNEWGQPVPAHDRVYARRANWCEKPGQIHGSYDVAMDPWDRVYVASTSCARVVIFDAEGQYLAAHDVSRASKNHYIAVDAKGGFYTPENTLYSRPTDPTWNSMPWPQLPSRVLAACPDKTWAPNVVGPNGSGQAGNNGQVVIACKTDLALIGTNGTLAGRVALPAGARYYDAAPSPDWSSIYVTRVTNYSAATGRSGNPEIVRMVRQGAAGSLTYALDATWKPAQFRLANKNWTVRSRYISTDAYGDIYASNGGWAGYYTDANDAGYVYETAPGVVVKLAPNGAALTVFNGSDPTLGEFDTNMGVAVSRGGDTVWVVEHTKARAQKFTRQLNGSYAPAGAATAIAAKDATCATANGMSVPYDIGLDPWGNVFIASTGCRKLHKYSPGGQMLWSRSTPEQAHGIAVGMQGEVYAASSDLAFTADAAPGPVPPVGPKPVPDATAPVLSAIGVADPTPTRTPLVTLTATDNVAITQMRVANNVDGSGTEIYSAPWRAYSATFSHELTGSTGVRGFYVQVRDAAGNVSAIKYRTTTVDVPNSAPQLVSATAPATTYQNTVTIAISATDDQAVTGIRTANENDSLGDAPWKPYSPQLVHQLSPGAGFKAIFVQVRDGEGQTSNYLLIRTQVLAAATVTPGVNNGTNGGGIIAPTQPGSTTGGGAAAKDAAPYLKRARTSRTTRKRDIKVRIAASDDKRVTRVRFANESQSLAKAKWRKFKPTMKHRLSKGSGYKGFWVQVADASGNVSNIRYIRVTVKR